MKLPVTPIEYKQSRGETQSIFQTEHAFLGTSPAKNDVVKTTVGENILFSCKMSPELADKNNDIIVEVWTNASGQYQGYELAEHDDAYFAKILFKNTGFFNATFRWRLKHQNYWNWLVPHGHEEMIEIHVDPAYIQNAIVYNAFIRFFGHEKIVDKGVVRYGMSGTFGDLKKKLDDIKELGVNILYINPIHPIGELYRNYNPHDLYPSYMQPGCPYSVKDYKAIDVELGIDKDHTEGPYASLSDPMKEFKEFVDAAHEREIKIVMDLVFGHTAHDFVLQRLHPEWFLYKDDIKSLDAPYIYPEEIKQGKPWGDPAHTVCPYDHDCWWEDVAQLNWEHTVPPAGNDPPKNPTLKEMYEYFKSIPKYWIKHFGVDGFRCDVAYRVPTKFWKECIHEARETAKREHKNNGSITGDVIFIAESYVDNIPELFSAGFSAVYGDYSNKLYSPVQLRGYLDYIYNISGKFFPQGSKFFIFPECHDFHRNTKKLLAEHEDSEKILAERANMSRWALTASLPGIPMIFNGLEKLEWHQVNLFSYSDINWESDGDLRKFIIAVNKIRNSYKALQKGTYTYVHTNQENSEKPQLFAFMREYEGETFLVCVNMDVRHKADAVTIFLPESRNIDFSKKYTLNDLLNKKKYSREGDNLLIILEPGESHIFKIEQIDS